MQIEKFCVFYRRFQNSELQIAEGDSFPFLFIVGNGRSSCSKFCACHVAMETFSLATFCVGV